MSSSEMQQVDDDDDFSSQTNHSLYESGKVVARKGTPPRSDSALIKTRYLNAKMMQMMITKIHYSWKVSPLPILTFTLYKFVSSFIMFINILLTSGT